jgi:anti-anti-sigma factor
MAIFSTEVHPDHVVIRIKKKLDTTDIGEFTAEWKNATASDICRVILDLSGLDRMDSSGMGAIATLRNHLVSRNGKLVLLNGPNNICKVFEIAGMRTKIEITDEPEEALKIVLS